MMDAGIVDVTGVQLIGKLNELMFCVNQNGVSIAFYVSKASLIEWLNAQAVQQGTVEVCV